MNPRDRAKALNAIMLRPAPAFAGTGSPGRGRKSGAAGRRASPHATRRKPSGSTPRKPARKSGRPFGRIVRLSALVFPVSLLALFCLLFLSRTPLSEAPKVTGGMSAPQGQNTAPPPRPEGSAPLVPSRERPAKTDKPIVPAASVSKAAPFAGQDLKAVTAELQRRYAGRTPVKWAERMPGITSRLGPASAPGKPESARGAPFGTGGGNGAGAAPVLALTLDACSGAYDAELIAFLRERRIPATLFVAGPWLRRNPEIFADLAGDPLFEIAAHGNAHKPCSVDGREVYGIKGTASMAELVKEVEANARDLERAGVPRPRWFRSATAFYDDVAVAVIHDLGLNVAGYSIAVDEGATLPAGRVRAKTLTAQNGDILLAHMNHPTAGTRKGLMEALPLLQERGFVFVRLSEYGGSAPKPPAGD